MRVGEVIAERFVLQRIAGEGGMGTVFEAHDREANGPVALKVLQGRLGG
jgi:serine/threonine protein kinase